MKIDTTPDHIDLLRRSEKFQQWRPTVDGGRPPTLSALEQSNILAEKYYTPDLAEKYYTPDELSELWAVSTETIRSIFRNEPGVLKIGKPGTRNKRAYFTLRIPADVAERIHARLSA